MCDTILSGENSHLTVFNSNFSYRIFSGTVTIMVLKGNYLHLLNTACLLACFALLPNVAFPGPRPSAHAECVKINPDESLDLRIYSSGKTKKLLPFAAQKAAIEAVLFNGMADAGVCGSRKALLRNEAERLAFQKIEKQFFGKKGDWTRFVSGIRQEASKENQQKPGAHVYVVTVAVQPLRSYMEEKKVIEKLNKIY